MGSTDPARLRWWKSSRSSGGADNCVEVAESGGGYPVRDSKQHGHGPVLTFTRSSGRRSSRASSSASSTPR